MGRRLLGGFVELVEAGEMALGIERGHAAEPGGGHRLAIDVVGHVARGETPGMLVAVE